MDSQRFVRFAHPNLLRRFVAGMTVGAIRDFARSPKIALRFCRGNDSKVNIG
jgi:hypothetical protein